jgi:HSP20 family molecular chaperone IbpA
MPSTRDGDQVEAKIADDVLTPTFPKAESVKPKKVNIKSI